MVWCCSCCPFNIYYIYYVHIYFTVMVEITHLRTHYHVSFSFPICSELFEQQHTADEYIILCSVCFGESCCFFCLLVKVIHRMRDCYRLMFLVILSINQTICDEISIIRCVFNFQGERSRDAALNGSCV